MDYSKFQIAPIKGEVEFQKFCLALARREWNDKHAQIHGRRGQAQDGVDISGQDNNADGALCGIQCKGSEKNAPRKLTEKEIQVEVDAAKGYEPPLTLLIVAYAGDRDKNLQKYVRKLNESHKADGLFRVVLRSWDDLLEELESHPELQNEFLHPLVVRGAAPSADVDPARPKRGVTELNGVMENGVASRSAHFSEGSEGVSPDDAVANAKLDLLRDQVLGGDAKAALKALEAFAKEADDKGSERIKFRAHANLGAAFTRLGRFEEAAVQYEIAGNTAGDTADGHAYLANAAQIRDDRAKAHEESKLAIGLDSSHALANAIFIESAPEDESPEALEKVVGNAAAEMDVGWALARRFAAAGLNRDAIRVAEGIAEKEVAWARDIAIGEAILGLFEEDDNARIGAPLDAASNELIAKSVRCLEAGWEKVKSRGDGHIWAHVGANLSVAYRLSGRAEEAHTAALEAYGIAPKSKGIQARAALTFLQQGEAQKSAELAITVAESGDGEDLLFAASMCAAADRFIDCAGLAEKAYAVCTGSDKGRAAELVILSIAKTSGFTEAIQRARDIQDDIEPSIAFISRVAELARRAGDAATLDEMRRKLTELEKNELSAIERFELADALADDAQWGKAADLLDGLYALDRPSELLRRRLFLLYRADLRAEARELYGALSGDALKSTEIRRLGAAIFERSGMISEAITELGEALKLDQDDLRCRLDWVRLQLRNGGDRTVERWIRKAPINIKGDVEERLELAQLLDRFGRREDALRLGYEIIRKNWGKSERAHMMYMSLFLLRGNVKEDSLFPTRVGADTVVFLSDQNGERRRYRIEEWPEAEGEVLAPDHAFAKAFEGHAVGDKVTVDRGMGETSDWTVLEIKHKYLDLFHRVMEEHETLFPGNSSLTRFHIDTASEDSFEPVFEQVRARARRVDEVSKFYQEKGLPVDVVATALGVDTIDASLGLRFSSGIRLQSCLGTPIERQAAEIRLKESQAIVVDPLTLAFWREIGLLPHLENHPSLNIEVVQSTIDALARRVEEARMSVAQEGGSLTAQGEKILLTDVSQEQRDGTLKIWEDLLQWVRDHSRLVPTENIELPDDKAIIAEVLSPESYDTIAAATRDGRLLISEDFRLRNIARDLGAPNGAWTQPLVKMLLDAGDITDAEYARLLATMHVQQLQFVSVCASDLLTAMRGDDDVLLKLFEALALPNVDAQSLLVVASQFCVALWLDRSLVSRREKVTSKLLWTILTSRSDSGPIVRGIMLEVHEVLRKRRFPDSYVRITWDDYAEGFLRGHFLPFGD